MAVKYTISVNVYEEYVKDFMPLYEESNKLITALGYRPQTFEEWYKDMLTVGCTHKIKRDAEFLNECRRRQLERGKDDGETHCDS